MDSDKVLSSALGFTRAVLGLECYPWTEKVLLDLDRPGKVAVRAANGVGKTSRLAAPAALWNAAVHPGSLTIVSAGVSRQAGEIVNAIRDYRGRFRHWEFLSDEIRTPHRSRILSFTADKPELFEGFHNDHLLIVLDECKSIVDGIYTAALRCQPERLLLLSSPGPCSGFFYDSFNKNRKFFRTHAITAQEAPHVSQAWISETIAEYGESHPFVRSAVFGEFMVLSDEHPIPLLLVERLLAEPPAITKGSTKAFLDFAAGSAENVCAIRRGNVVSLAACWRESDTARAIGKFISLFRQYNLEPREIMGDADGMGVVFCDLLSEQGWPIERWHGGLPAMKSDVYNNRSAELWYEARNAIEKRQIVLPNDQTLIGQLTSRKGWIDSKGRLCLESKDDMKKRGLASPDRADAVLGAMLGCLPGLEPAKFCYAFVKGARPRLMASMDALGGCREDRWSRRGGLQY